MSMNTQEHIDKILTSFKIKACCVNEQQIDNYYFYDLKLLQNGKIKDIQRYVDEISLALQFSHRPSVKPLYSQGLVRLEFNIPRKDDLVLLKYLASQKSLPDYDILCLLGQAVDGQPVWMDLAQNPHMIVAGTTGSGKSVLLHNIIANLSILNEVELFLSDPKSIEFIDYKGQENINIVTSYTDTIKIIEYLLVLMEDRYRYLRNGNTSKYLTNTVLIIDEFADLIIQDQDERFYKSLCKLAQKCRAAKIYIILSTQRPSVDIIRGAIKANFPARISCRVATHVDSKVILDAVGAENLVGKGDALIRDNTRHIERFQIAYANAKETCSYLPSICNKK
jgi:S-DNA-T family DNA segregation ATPase FtsK/SpoIIIE